MIKAKQWRRFSFGGKNQEWAALSAQLMKMSGYREIDRWYVQARLDIPLGLDVSNKEKISISDQ